VVTAKGDDDLAWRMIDEARKQGVFISEDPQSLRPAESAGCTVDEIPEGLHTRRGRRSCLGPIRSKACALGTKKKQRIKLLGNRRG
jgi:hypothetical protein